MPIIKKLTMVYKLRKIGKAMNFNFRLMWLFKHMNNLTNSWIRGNSFEAQVQADYEKAKRVLAQ